MLGPGADRRPADSRPAPQGPAQRPLDSAEIHTETHLADGDAPALVPRHAADQAPHLRHIIGHARNVNDLSSISIWTHEQFDPRLSWSDVAWIKEKWGGPLIIKGINDVEDAKLAAETGADAIIISNHGGRQLDGTPSSISMLPAIADAVGHKIEIHLDGGIRSGQDVLKAVALGAKGTYIGRPFLYGLGAMGKEGVTLALEILRKEMDTTMALCGKRDIRTVDASIIAGRE